MSEESVGTGTEETSEGKGSPEVTERSKPSAQDSFASEADKIRDALGIVDGQAILTLID